MKNLNELAKEIHQNAINKGFYIDYYTTKHLVGKKLTPIIDHVFFAQKIALIHSELSEAIEADRKNRYLDLDILKEKYLLEIELFNDKNFKEAYEMGFKHSVNDELVDAIIRVLDLCAHLDINIQKHVELKMKYNSLREHKHGKEY